MVWNSQEKDVCIPDIVTSIGTSAFEKSTVILANEGSYALTRAQQNNYKYRNLNEKT